MISEMALKRTLSSLLQKEFPDFSIYGQAEVEGWDEPALFLEVALTNMVDETVNIVSKTYSVIIQYRDEKAEEEEKLEVFEGIREALRCVDEHNRKRKMVVKVTDNGVDRYIKVSNLLYVYAGDDLSILQIQFNMSFYDFDVIRDDEKDMEHVEEEITVEEA